MLASIIFVNDALLTLRFCEIFGSWFYCSRRGAGLAGLLFGFSLLRKRYVCRALVVTPAWTPQRKKQTSINTLRALRLSENKNIDRVN